MQSRTAIYRSKTPTSLSNINIVSCHEKIRARSCILPLLLLVAAQKASPQFSRITKLAAPEEIAPIDRPDFSIKIPRPDAPARGQYLVISDNQEADGLVRHLRGNVVIELYNATLKADFIDYDEDTSIFTARGKVQYRNYEQNEVIYCDSLEYDSTAEKGTFHHVRGFLKTKIVARPGLLTTQEPFYFEGVSADKIQDRYILHDGFITDCVLPKPWWTIHSSKIDIIPDDRVTAHKAVYKLRSTPAFYFPWFQKSLKKEPRKSGLLTPSFGHSSRRGWVFSAGYYAAINRSLDATYIFQNFSKRGMAHHIDFRGKPTQRTDFNLIFFGVQDRGVTQNGFTSKAPGFSVTGAGRTEFGNGWTARGSINFISSLAFRQQFTESFNEAIFAQTQSTASVGKNFGYYAFDIGVSRRENFLNDVDGNAIILRKLPEVTFSGRDQQIVSGKLPVWFSFESSYGLQYRRQPKPPGPLSADFYQTNQFTTRATADPSVTTRFDFKQFHLVPSFTLHNAFYTQSFTGQRVDSVNLGRTAPEISIDFIMPTVERVFSRKSFLGDKIKHVIEPRATYRYVSNIKNFTQTLRFDPLDLLSGTNEIQLGVINRLYAKRGDSINEVLTWEVFQKRYFDPTFGGSIVPGQRNTVMSSLQLTPYSFIAGGRTYSPVVSILRVSPRPGFGLTWMADYDPLLQRFVNSTLAGDVRFKKYFISVGSDQVRPNPLIAPPANQFRNTFGYGDPNRRGWNAAFSSVYDYRKKELNYGVGQVTYNTDCCGISFQLRRFDFGTRQGDNTYLVSFSIANIATVGNLKKQERLF
ncbi:MAG: Organic solvent tolerance protein [Bryobacterales bacterium]|nr:Organic solvent tolerance protein [Bryobacterales bacterium]